MSKSKYLVEALQLVMELEESNHKNLCIGSPDDTLTLRSNLEGSIAINMDELFSQLPEAMLLNRKLLSDPTYRNILLNSVMLGIELGKILGPQEELTLSSTSSTIVDVKKVIEKSKK